MAASRTGNRARVRSVTHPERPEGWTVPQVARYLNDNLGPKLVAHMVGVSPQTVARWADGAQKPPGLEAE